MFRITVMGAMILGGLALAAPRAHAHCQVPCGIYRDGARVRQMMEDHRTIAKVVVTIKALAKKKDLQSKHQLIRWVMTKEQHAERIIRTVSDYFLAQKIKPPKAGTDPAPYFKLLAQHHAVLVAAMKCKQSSSAKDPAALLKAIEVIRPHWTKSKGRCKHKPAKGSPGN